MQPRSDEELLADHLAGKTGAFDTLAARHVNELFAFLSRFVGSATVAEDLVQETFLQIHLSAASFDHSRAFKPWLYTIAANKARDQLRVRSRRQELSLDAVAGRDDDGPAPSASLEADEAPLAEHLDSAEQAEQVRRVVGGMPEHLRMVLLLGYYQQLHYAEIAEILDIPVGTVKSRLHAAVNHFAKLWRSRMQGSAPVGSAPQDSAMQDSAMQDSTPVVKP